MSDDWEDEDFVPTLNTAPSASAAGEVDLMETGTTTVDAAALKANDERRAKLAEQQEAAFARRLEDTKHSNETDSERKLRERRQVEEADNELTNELFQGAGGAGSGSKSPAVPVVSSVGAAGDRNFAKSSGLGSIQLTTNQDHLKFGNLVHVKLQASTPLNVVAFYRGLSAVLKQTNITAETLDDIVGEINKIRESKVKPATGKKGEVVKKAADKKKEDKRHEDVFGFTDKRSKYDAYDDMEDEFM